MTKKAVLVVEDEPLIRLFAREVLEDVGYHVKEAANAHDAIRLLESDGIGAVLTDIEMPGSLNGLDLAWMIRARWPNIAVVVTSGRVLPRPDELPQGTPMLPKPFSSERLLSLFRWSA